METQTQRSPADAASTLSVLDSAVAATLTQKVQTVALGRSGRWKSEAEEQVGALLSEVMQRTNIVSTDAVKLVRELIGKLDALLTVQLNEVMHHTDVQKLEAAWRGLHYLVNQTQNCKNVMVRVMPVCKDDLRQDLDVDTPEEIGFLSDATQLFRKVYEDEYGTPGGNPYGLLIGDFEFGDHPQDIELLKRISKVAAAAHAPFIAAAAPQLFEWDSFHDNLNKVRDIGAIFKSNVEWQSFRATDDSRYVGLVLPHILLRKPYGPDSVPVPEFSFSEDVSATKAKSFLWANAAYALGVRMANAFDLYGFCVAIRGSESGGRVSGLPFYSTAANKELSQGPTEVLMTERRGREFSEQGFISIEAYKDTDYAVFFSVQSCQKPKRYDDVDATASAHLSGQLQYLMAAARFAHYLKVLVRDQVGGFMDFQDCKAMLQRWVNQYVNKTPGAGPEMRAKYPLREAAVAVTEDPERPGSYQAELYLVPQIQLEDLTVGLSMVARLPPPSAK